MEFRPDDAGDDQALGEAAYRRLLGSLVEVDPRTWLNAMPRSVVAPSNEERVVAAMLEDVRVPQGLDRHALLPRGEVTDRYQMAAHVAGTVACASIERLAAARESGDEHAAAAAIAALRQSHRWAILKNMPAGSFSDDVWAFADAAIRGETPAKSSYRQGLGC